VSGYFEEGKVLNEKADSHNYMLEEK